jgi:hypothetical protein
VHNLYITGASESGRGEDPSGDTQNQARERDGMRQRLVGELAQSCLRNLQQDTEENDQNHGYESFRVPHTAA